MRHDLHDEIHCICQAVTVVDLAASFAALASLQPVTCASPSHRAPSAL